MTERETNILRNRLVPCPREAVFSDGADYCLKNGCAVTLCVPEDLAGEAKEYAEGILSEYWQVTTEANCAALRKKRIHPEGYELTVKAEKLTVSAVSVAGVRNAFRTLRQLAETERNVEHFSCYILPPCEIRDAPAMDFRGIHFCWFPETPYWEMEKQLRLAAYMKFNYAVIEPWGVFPYKSHPELVFQDMKIKRKEMKKLVRLAYELGVTPIPQINIFGHASWARSGSGKHATLGSHPELASLFEPGGWAWCLSNPATREYLTDIIEEIMDVFGNPPFFHAGCDEADHMATCSVCRKHPAMELVRDHLTYFHDLAAKRGARMLMWHDMLLERQDPRWKGYIVCGEKLDGLAGLYKELPKDIVICDWQYGQPNPESKIEWPTSVFFKKAGFDVLACPWTDQTGARKFIRFAAEKKLFGVLQTTWHRNRGFSMPVHYVIAGNRAWNPDADHDFGNVALYIQQIDSDAGLFADYRTAGRSVWQIVPESYPD